MKILVLAFLISFSSLAADCGKKQTTWMGAVESGKLDEISGIAFSKKHNNVLYAHNDSGDKPRIFIMSTEGKKLGKIEIEGATHVDWEDIAVMNCPGEIKSSCIAVGDIGDNKYKRKTQTIYIVKEPTVLNSSKKIKLPIFKKIKFKLDTQRQNFESLISFRDELFLISKMDGNAGQEYPGEEGKSIVYRIDMKTKVAKTIGRLDLLKTKEFYKKNEEGESVMKVQNYFAWATGADLSEDGKTLYLLTYGIVFKFNLGSGGIHNPKFNNYKLIKIPEQPQVEAIAFSGKDLFLVSEYRHQPLYKITCQNNGSESKY